MKADARRVSDRVGHMLEAIENIRADIGQLSQAQFLATARHSGPLSKASSCSGKPPAG